MSEFSICNMKLCETTLQKGDVPVKCFQGKGFQRFTEIGQIFQNGSGNHEVNFKSKIQANYYLREYAPDPS